MMRILIVEDNPVNLKMICLALKSENYEIRTAEDAEEALAIIPKFKPQLILMDIQLPGVDGFELTYRIKKDPATQNIKIIAVTAYAMQEDQEKALRAGCDGYITKPIDSVHLPEQIAKFLGHKPKPVPIEPVKQTLPVVRAQGQGSILVIENNPTTRKMFRLTLKSAGYQVMEASDSRTAIELLQNKRPDLILQDLVLPDIEGLEFANILRKHLGDAQVPIICIAGFFSHLDEVKAMQKGFTEVLVKPVNSFALLDMVKAHLIVSTDEIKLGRGRLLLLVDDDPLQCKIGQILFSNAGFNVLWAGDGAAGLEIARKKRPAVIVSDILMPKMDGFSFCLAVRSDNTLKDVPVILNSSSYIEEADRKLAKRVGAHALFTKTNGLDAIVKAVIEILESPVMPFVLEDDQQINLEHNQRALWQLERQVTQNKRLSQRAMLLEAQLAVLAGIAGALTTNKVVNGVLGDVLAACLDMAGISKGILYIVSANGHLELKHQIGFLNEDMPKLLSIFGLEDVLLKMTRNGRVVYIPSAEIPQTFAQKLMADTGVSTLLLVPVSLAEKTYGMMLLGARNPELSGEDALSFARVLGAQMGQAIGLAHAFEKIAISEKRYRTLMENANDAITISNTDGVVLEANSRLGEILNYSNDQIIGKHIRDFSAPGHEQKNMELYESLMREGSGRTVPIALRKANGDLALMEFSTAAVEIGHENLMFSIGRDVSEQARAQAQLVASDRMASVGTLAAGVAHEMNNPLAAAFGNLELALSLLKESSPAVEELKECVADAHSATEKVRQIVKDLKIFSRAEEENYGPVDVQKVLDSTLRMAWNEIRHRAQLVKTYEKVPFVQASESRLGQVFLNLIVNAAQAIPEGHADINEIQVQTFMDKSGWVVVEIRDTGPGISPEVLKNLFTPFFTTKAPGVGTGLGLTICQRIMTGLGGEIKVKSSVGKGTTFQLFLPQANESVVSENVTTPIAATRRGNILIVDDDLMICTMVRRTLLQDHDVTVLTNAKEALECIANGNYFDVILCDMMMPVMTGMEFYRQLRKNHLQQAERIIFLTGGVFTVEGKKFLENVPNIHLEKPFATQSLKNLINEKVN